MDKLEFANYLIMEAYAEADKIKKYAIIREEYNYILERKEVSEHAIILKKEYFSAEPGNKTKFKEYLKIARRLTVEYEKEIENI